MPRAAPIQSTFNAGELSPVLEGRSDIEQYAKGVRLCKNFIPRVQGPLERRPGTRFVVKTKNDNDVIRLVPFQFSDIQAYILEIGDGYIRFIRNRGANLEANVTITGITNANPAVVTAIAHGFSNGDKVFIQSVVGMTEVNGKFFTVANQTANTFELSGTDSTGFTAYTSGGTVARVFEIVAPWALSDLPGLHFIQSADILYVTHPNFLPRKISRTGHTTWTITAIAPLDGPYTPINITTTTLGLSATTGSVTVTASSITGINNNTGFQATDVGRLIRWKDPASKWTWLEITAFTSTTIVTATIKGANASAITATVNWRLGLWNDADGYPTTLSFHQGRLGFSGNSKEPQRLDLSRTDDFENFSPTDPDGTVVDDHAIVISFFNDTVNLVRWMMDDEQGLIVGTAGGEWIVRPSTLGEVLTPTNVQAKRSSTRGSEASQAVKAGSFVLFIQKFGRKLREFGFSFAEDKFRSSDLSLLSEHITKTGLQRICFQKEPFEVVWSFRKDGQLLSMNYVPEQKAIGWVNHILGGFSNAGKTSAAIVEDIAIIPRPDNSGEDTWFVVNRYINGKTIRYIEYLTETWEQETLQTKAFFVDSGLSYSGVPITNITNLDHLEGETVSILSDGSVHPDKIVTAGKITLNSAASDVHVGLSYNSDVQLLRSNFGSADGTSQGKIKRIDHVILRLWRSLGGKFGIDASDLDTITFRDSGDAMDTAVPLFDGDLVLEWNGDVDREAFIFFRQDQPLPFTILAVMPQLDTRD